LAEFARVAFADITDVVEITETGAVNIKPTRLWSKTIRAAVSEVRQGPDGIVVKFHSKSHALEQLAKHLGLTKENVELNLNVSLADLVNGSYKLEKLEAQTKETPVIEHEPTAGRNTNAT
jgi:Terminase small subunit